MPGEASNLTLITARERRAHRQSVEMTIADVATYLQDAVGQKLTGYMANVKDFKVVGKWARGEQEPHPASQERMRLAYRVFHYLQDAESTHTVRAWFVGLNPQLEDESPATAIREGRFKEVVVAARAFLTGG
jgi:hypothetical protein